MMRIAITGATGLIGRNLLFEIIKQNLDQLDNVELIVLGRSKNKIDIHRRMKDIISDDGIAYISPNKMQMESLRQYCEKGIKGIHIDLSKEKLGLSKDDFLYLKSSPIDFFIHLAALTDLRRTSVIEKALQRINVMEPRRFWN